MDELNCISRWLNEKELVVIDNMNTADSAYDKHVYRTQLNALHVFQAHIDNMRYERKTFLQRIWQWIRGS